MNECNSEHRDMFSLPLTDGILLNIELYSCNAFLSINSTLNLGLSIWWIAKAHNKMHFIMYMWQPHLLLKCIPNTIVFLKSSKINIKSQPQVRISFLLNNQALPQLYPNLTYKYSVQVQSLQGIISQVISVRCIFLPLRNNWSSNFFYSLNKTVSMLSILFTKHKVDNITKK